MIEDVNVRRSRVQRLKRLKKRLDDESGSESLRVKNAFKVLEAEPRIINFGTVHAPDGTFALVGYSPVPSRSDCGKVRKTRMCKNPEGHGLVCKDGETHIGEQYIRKVRFSCGKPSCPECFRAYCVREAGRAEFRFFEASKIYGKPEHVTISVPVKDYKKPVKWMFSKALEVVKARRVLGGSLVFHAFRWDDKKLWVYKPHFHSVCYLEGGYKCRGCKKLCRRSCKGWEATTRRLYENDGWIVKVLDPLHERISVFYTLLYELGHATVKVGVKNARVLTWWGVMSYRALKLSDEARKKWDEEHKEKCPLCGSELVDCAYVGSDSFESFDDMCLRPLYENGRLAWVVLRDVVDMRSGASVRYGYDMSC